MFKFQSAESEKKTILNPTEVPVTVNTLFTFNVTPSIEAATSVSAGFMSAEDKIKLSGLSSVVESNDINISEEIYDSIMGNFTLTGSEIPLATSSGEGFSYSVATTVQSGLMSAADKTKLDNLELITAAGKNITINNGIISSGIDSISSRNIYIDTNDFNSIMSYFSTVTAN